MKLEKLVYYCQSWHLARCHVPLFAEEIEAWAQGPVVRTLYDRHRQTYLVRAWPSGDASRLGRQERETVGWVVGKYGSLSAERLSRMTHAEGPWRVARAGLADNEPSRAPISRELMANYYARQCADVETAVASAAANAALEGVELDMDWQDRLREVASGVVSGDLLVAEEIARQRRD
jgi:uncharacterized phage-associated protein